MQKDAYINSVNLNIATDFPYLVLEGCDGKLFPVNRGFRVMHWHEDIQLIYVLRGELSVKTLDGEVLIRAGEGIFINKYVVHFISYEGSCHYYNFLFPDYFLGFYTGGPAHKAVEYLSGRAGLPVYHLNGALPWHGAALNCLRRLADLETEEKTEFYAYEVLVNISAFWLQLCKNLVLPPLKQEKLYYKRMRKFLDYIEAHCAEDIKLEDIAACANVSKSECLRCFKKSMQMTPYQYLIELRLAKAAALLRQTDDAVGDIALNVGFQQSSHFGKFFKAKTGLTPLAYRRQNKLQEEGLKC